MKRKKISFDSPEEVTEFINICNSYISDINIWDGHIVIDAKSIVSMFSITDGKVIETEIISSDFNDINDFLNKIRKFEVI